LCQRLDVAGIVVVVVDEAELGNARCLRLQSFTASITLAVVVAEYCG
jgi:hypothetical protein